MPTKSCPLLYNFLEPVFTISFVPGTACNFNAPSKLRQIISTSPSITRLDLLVMVTLSGLGKHFLMSVGNNAKLGCNTTRGPGIAVIPRNVIGAA